ncbi:hypothetical protein ABK040_001435 [Willaertia magna]
MSNSNNTSFEVNNNMNQQHSKLSEEAIDEIYFKPQKSLNILQLLHDNNITIRLGSKEYDDYLEKAIELAYLAGSMAVRFCDDRINSPSLDIEIKKDESPVTMVDKKINQFIVSELGKAFENVRIVGEEDNNNKESSVIRDYSDGLVFFVDPVDGTKDFILNNGEWAVMIGLSFNGASKMGVIYCAQFDEMFFAIEGYGAYMIKGKKELNKIQCKQFHVEEQDDNNNEGLKEGLKECTCLISRSNYDKLTGQILDDLGISKRVPCGSFGRKACLIACGKADLYLNISGKSSYWDTCAPSTILHEANGCLFRKNGQPVVFNGISTKNNYVMFCCPSSIASRVKDTLGKVLVHLD